MKIKTWNSREDAYVESFISVIYRRAIELQAYLLAIVRKSVAPVALSKREANSNQMILLPNFFASKLLP